MISSVSNQLPNLTLADTLASANGKNPNSSASEDFLAQFQQLQQPSNPRPHRHHHYRPTDQYNNLASLIGILQSPTATNIQPANPTT